MLGAKARALSDATFWVLALNVLTRGFTDLGTAFGAAAALALGAWRVQHGEMSLQALLIVLMAGTEIFRPLRDLRTVLHAGLNGQSAANGINALMDTPVTAPARPAHPDSIAGIQPEIKFDTGQLRLSRRPQARAHRPDLPHRGRRACGRGRAQRIRQIVDRAAVATAA